jgi:hypothetical protein
MKKLFKAKADKLIYDVKALPRKRRVVVAKAMLARIAQYDIDERERENRGKHEKQRG